MIKIQDREKGIILILLSALFFALMAATVKFLGDMPIPEKIFFRNLLGAVAVYYMIKKSGKSFKVNNKKFLAIRLLTGVSGMVCYYYALSKIHLSDAVMLHKMAPFFVIVFSAFFLGEKIKKPQYIALVLAVTGAVFVIKPRFDSSVIPSLIAFASALFSGITFTIIRYLKNSDSAQIIVFYFVTFLVIVMFPFMLAGYFVMPTPKEWIALILLGIFGTAGQLLMTNAYHFAPAGELSIYTYSNIIFSTLIGLIFWTEIPDYLSLIGGIIIIIAGIINYRSKENVRTNG